MRQKAKFLFSQLFLHSKKVCYLIKNKSKKIQNIYSPIKKPLHNYCSPFPTLKSKYCLQQTFNTQINPIRQHKKLNNLQKHCYHFLSSSLHSRQQTQKTICRLPIKYQPSNRRDMYSAFFGGHWRFPVKSILILFLLFVNRIIA